MPPAWFPVGAGRAEIEAAIASLTESEAYALLYDWRGTWARAEQLWPAGEWVNWVVQAGRGFGKTRTGAEATREETRNPAGRIALVGPTAADVRDVMIEGESGLLNVFPPWERPEYESSKRKITFRSGAVAFLYSAEEPERLRGPQHSFAWCLIGDTQVLMADGSEKPIREIRPGDSVWTRTGVSRVTASALTRRNASLMRLLTAEGREIIGTSDHPVWIDTRGFLPLASVVPGMSLSCVSNVLNGTVLCGIVTGQESIGTERSGCIGPFGNPPMGRFPRGFKSTTLTKIRRITGLKTSRCFRIPSIAGFTCLRKSRLRHAGGPLNPQLRRWHESGKKTSSTRLFASGVERDSLVAHSNPVGIARANVWRRHVPAPFQVSGVSAPGVACPMRPESVSSSIARNNAIGVQPLTVRPAGQRGLSSVRDAVKDSRANELTPGSVTGNVPRLSTQRIVSVENLAICADVYDIAVEAGEFFANGILVHNCDEAAFYKEPQALWDNLKFGLRLGDNPRVVLTTTPQPSKFLSQLIEDSQTVVTRGTTFDNRANLPSSVLAEFERVYGGTRIGRQELYGELLGEAEGALWRRVQLEECRRLRAGLPELIRIVVAVDPAVTAGENSDETGIVVCGEDAAGNGYVLEDASCRLPPDQWAAEVVRAFDTWDADRVIAEANNGGDLVESVLRTVRRNLAYKKVHASRGKVARAEPVAALYEQSRIFHAGTFPQLEDEQVSFVPGKLGRRSPNRVDALVWGMTFLLLGQPKHIGKAIWVS